MRTFLLTSMLLMASLLATAQPIYKTVDDEGHVSYSDKPPRGNQPPESPELPPVNSVPEQAVPSGRPSDSEADATPQLQYSIEIVAPQPDSSVPPGQRDLPISVDLQPVLLPEHTLVYYLDDEPVAEIRSTQHIVREIYRGTHSVRVEVLDARGRVLGATNPVTIHVHRPSVTPRRGG